MDDVGGYMFKDIISMPETKYLGFGLMMPWENNLDIQFNLWQEGFVSGKIARLKEVCGCEQVIGIFCYKCDMETRTFSYHVACENTRNAVSEEFEELKIKALKFARFEGKCDAFDRRFEEYDALCGEIWGQWLPSSNYISLIEPETMGCVEGYGLIEIYNPENPAIVPYHFEMLLPIKGK